MLYVLKNLTDKFFNSLLDDPVRPTIPQAERIGINKDVFVYRSEDNIAKAITCVSYQQTIPTKESELFEACTDPNTAVFYTIWSYAPGAGRTLIFECVKHIKETRPEITRFVTLSPKTEMAKRFHLKNGAIVFRGNDETVNYEYLSG